MSLPPGIRAIAVLPFGFVAGLAAGGLETPKKKSTLSSLLFAPEHRLRDLGIRRDELIRATGRGHR